MAVLPRGFHHDQGRSCGDAAKYFHAILLAIDESVALLRVARMPAAHVVSGAAYSIDDGLFRTRLRGPAHSVGGKAQVPVRDQNYRVRHLTYCDITLYLRGLMRAANICVAIGIAAACCRKGLRSLIFY